MRQLIFLFGEAEKGKLCMPIACHSLLDLSEQFGNPPTGEFRTILRCPGAFV